MDSLEVFGWCLLGSMVPGGAILGTFLALDGKLDTWLVEHGVTDKLEKIADWFGKIAGF